MKIAAVLILDRRNPPLSHGHAAVLLQPGMFEHGDTGLLEHLAEDLLGDVRLVQPGQSMAIPGHFIPLADTGIELPRKTSDHLFPAVIGVAQPSGNHTPQVAARLDERRFQALPRGTHGRHDSTGGTAVYDHVELPRCSVERRGQAEQQC
jgi:hypothetical protein